jgi:hypothetical protein
MQPCSQSEGEGIQSPSAPSPLHSVMWHHFPQDPLKHKKLKTKNKILSFRFYLLLKLLLILKSLLPSDSHNHEKKTSQPSQTHYVFVGTRWKIKNT